MTRSSAPGMLIALGVLIAALLLAFTVGRYPVGLADLFHVIVAKLEGGRPACRRLRSTSCCRCADRACSPRFWWARRSPSPAPLPGLVSQSAGVARYARRLVGRRSGRRARHLFLARRVRHRGFRVCRRPGGGRRRLSDRLGDARARSYPGPGADRRGDRRTARRRRRSRRNMSPIRTASFRP